MGVGGGIGGDSARVVGVVEIVEGIVVWLLVVGVVVWLGRIARAARKGVSAGSSVCTDASIVVLICFLAFARAGGCGGSLVEVTAVVGVVARSGGGGCASRCC